MSIEDTQIPTPEQPKGGEEEKTNERNGTTRRSFLKKIAAMPPMMKVAVGTWTGVGALELYRRREHILDALIDAQHTSHEDVQNAQRFIEEQYGVRVRFGPDHDDESFTAGRLDAHEARRTLAVLVMALAKYPHDFFRRNRLPKIRMAKDVALIRPIDGLQHEKAVGGFADVRDFIVVGYHHDLAVMEETLHHELYHTLDRRDGGSEEDARWEAINKSALPEKESAHEARRPLGERLPELFARSYGMLNAVEDQATIAAALLSVRHHATLIDHVAAIADDRVRHAFLTKIAFIKQEYHRWSGGQMDDAFWLRIERESRQRSGASSYAYEPPVYTDDWETYYDSSYEPRYGDTFGLAEPYADGRGAAVADVEPVEIVGSYRGRQNATFGRYDPYYNDLRRYRARETGDWYSAQR